MNETNQLDDDANESMNEGRGLCRVLAVGVLLAVATVAGCVFTGCALLDTVASDERVQAEFDRAVAEIMAALDKPDDGGTVETPTAPTAPQPEEPTAPGASNPDEVEFGRLEWKWGGFDGDGAKLDSPRLADLRCDGRNLTYRWATGMSGWGLGHDDAGAVCAVFFEREGQWVGGKFDWVSTSRSSRELKHVESYSNWPSSGIKLPWRGRVAFVVVSADGRKRSNVVEAVAK